jgi:hypothetical protein
MYHSSCKYKRKGSDVATLREKYKLQMLENKKLVNTCVSRMDKVGLAEQFILDLHLIYTTRTFEMYTRHLVLSGTCNQVV